MKILICHPLDYVLGGAELVLIHIMKRLLQDPENTVTLLSFKAPDLQKIENFSGIALPSDRVVSVQPDLPKILQHSPQSFFLMNAAFLQRKAKSLAPDYDLCISTYNEIDFGRKGLQYIHCPMFAPHRLLQKYKIIPEKSLINRYPVFSRLYLGLIAAVSRNTKAGITGNVSVVNSRFMQQVTKEAYGITPEVVYPSLVNLDSFKPDLGQKKAMRMVAVGRISSDKGTLELMNLYAAIHQRVPELELAVAGKVVDSDYYDAVTARARALNVPVKFMLDLPADDLQAVLKSSLFYINPKPFEHFGIATLEGVAAGCLTFVHKSGGSVEIVPCEDLQFESADELSRKVEMLVHDEAMRGALLSQLAENLLQFTPEEFYRQMDAAVASLLAGK